MTEVEKDVRAILEPWLLDLGFEGSFPVYRSLAPDQVKIVWVEVYVRGGVRIGLGSLPPRASLAKRSVESDMLAVSGGQLPPGVRRLTLPGYVPIHTAAARQSLPTTLAELRTTFRKQAKPFWESRAQALEEREHGEAVERALRKGDAKALALVPKKDRARALERATVDAYSATERAAMWKLASALITLPPTFYGPAAMLAFEALARKKGKDAKLAERVLAWAKPALGKTKHLAGQLALTASAVARSNPKLALAAFDFVLDAKSLSAVDLANALWCVMSDNNGEPVDSARHERFARVALKRYPADRFVRFNLACLAMELDDRTAALDHIAVAVALGLDRKVLGKEKLLRPLARDPRFRAIKSG